MEFLYSITTYKCGVYNIPEKLQMTTTFFTYYGTNLVFPVPLGNILMCLKYYHAISPVHWNCGYKALGSRFLCQKSPPIVFSHDIE